MADTKAPRLSLRSGDKVKIDEKECPDCLGFGGKWDTPSGELEHYMTDSWIPCKTCKETGRATLTIEDGDK